MKVDDFALLWEQLPKDLRAVAFRAPRDVVVDVDSLPPNERVAMLLSSGTALFLVHLTSFVRASRVGTI